MFSGEVSVGPQVEESVSGQSRHGGEAEVPTQVPRMLPCCCQSQTLLWLLWSMSMRPLVSKHVLASLDPSTHVRDLDRQFFWAFNNEDGDWINSMLSSLFSSLYTSSDGVQKQTVKNLPSKYK